MPRNNLRKAYYDILMDRVAECRFPSPTLLDRAELAVPDRASAEEYVGTLIDKMSQERFPSPMMLDRVNSLLHQLEWASHFDGSAA